MEGQIIRVADEFDAIVSKRQYKSHIGITDTLKILVDETAPNGPLNIGKLNKSVVKALLKVVIFDTEYEIYSVVEYKKYLCDEIKRLNQISSYIVKREKSKKESKKDFWTEYIKALCKDGETEKNINYVLEEYKLAVEKCDKNIKRLYDEIKEIKALRV